MKCVGFRIAVFLGHKMCIVYSHCYLLSGNNQPTCGCFRLAFTLKHILATCSDL